MGRIYFVVFVLDRLNKSKTIRISKENQTQLQNSISIRLVVRAKINPRSKYDILEYHKYSLMILAFGNKYSDYIH